MSIIQIVKREVLEIMYETLRTERDALNNKCEKLRTENAALSVQLLERRTKSREDVNSDLRTELANVKILFLRMEISRDELRAENQQLLYKTQELSDHLLRTQHSDATNFTRWQRAETKHDELRNSDKLRP